MLNIKLVGDAEMIARLDALPTEVRASLLRKVSALTLKLESKIKTDKLSGQVLKVRTGALRRSIYSEVQQTPDSVIGIAASSGDVKYGRIHEFGGTTRPHVIEPVKAKALAFMLGGKQRFFKQINHPGSKMPARSFMRSSLKEMFPEITTGLMEAVREGLDKK